MNHQQLLAFLKAEALTEGQKRVVIRLLKQHPEWRAAFCKGEPVTPELDRLRQELKLDIYMSWAAQEMKRLQTRGGWILSPFDEHFPAALFELDDFPLVLFGIGNFFHSHEKTLSVVGTRKPTSYGKRICQRLVSELSKRGLTIISGMAWGIDTIAHRAALDENARTMAVMGTGLGHIYPRQNQALHAEITEKGAVVSEFFFDQGPHKYTFPKRNRIVAALGKGLLVVEGGDRSGAGITADFALDLGRDIFALPGPIDQEMSALPNNLLYQGAKPVRRSEDILECYGLTFGTKSASNKDMEAMLSPVEKKIIDLIKRNNPISIDALIDRSGLDMTIILESLQDLEDRKYVAPELDGRYAITLGEI